MIEYGTKWCPACNSLKAKLQARNIPFESVDLENPQSASPQARAHQAEIPSDKRNAIPVTRIANKGGVSWVQGDGADQVEQAYRAK